MAGLNLALEKHEQEGDELHSLLVAQLKLECQRNHWRKPLTMLAGLPTVEVGICKAPCLALALGLPRMALSVGLIGQGFPLLLRNGAFAIAPLAAYRAAIRGVVAPRNRYPARGSARVTSIGHNVGGKGRGAGLPAERPS